ncbi:cobalt-zinc-cadmium efflux system membrane fusion protein [Mariniflexile fucanivorans]|uniref:Cobalt-zinc-cadmium efflux system membrane fusion protein n=1 Tax=Mariniflexile fucanivorans TaxID=264023 RepID=A0A4R1RR21_9FLAO|nr:efflux RND transporter periplasmic adaptor subunit [Mariniflexile fucanivorans]TCL68868.1 cobalt-zinc-cadmium efflux system membrane fusion protein [Mariniflexile fucanivorans]
MKHIYILAFSLALVACGNSEKNKESVVEEAVNSNDIEITQSQFTSENMQLGTLEEQVFNEEIKTSGMIDVPPHNKASVSAFMGGYITKTPLLIGDKVRKGQLLVTLENPEFVEIQQQYLEVSEQLNYLKSEYNRQKTLFDEKITSEKNYLKAEGTYKSSLAQYNGLRKKLSMMNISAASVEQGKITSTVNLYATIDGFVTKVNVSNGTYVSPADVILEIVDTNHIHLELSVFEKDILKVNKGQKIRFKIPEASNETFEAEVHLVGTTIDEINRSVKVHAHIINEEQTNFIVGMFVEAHIITNSATSFALPKEAILELEDSFYALIIAKKENNTFHFKKIKLDLGAQNENYATILNADALKNKDILIKGGFILLNEGGE